MEQSIALRHATGPAKKIIPYPIMASRRDTATTKFRVEPMINLFADASHLFPAHYAEVGRNRAEIPLDYDAEAYLKMEDDDLARLFMARRGGAVVAYAVYFITFHPRYAGTTWATGDMFYVARAARAGGVVAKGLFQFIEDVLRDAGVTIMHTSAKNAVPGAQRLLEYLGHKPIETVLEKILQPPEG